MKRPRNFGSARTAARTSSRSSSSTEIPSVPSRTWTKRQSPSRFRLHTSTYADADCTGRVEFGELRQFLRLDAQRPAHASPAAPLAPSIPTVSTQNQTDKAHGAHSPPSDRTGALDAALSKPKPSLDDFADLDLTEEELASLARELTGSSADETRSALLSASQSRPTDSGTSSSASGRPEGGGYSFSTSQQFAPSYAPTAPLKLERVNFVRPIDRRLADRDREQQDFLAGLDPEAMDEDALEKLARELELEDERHRRSSSSGRLGPQTAAGSGAGTGKLAPAVKTVESTIPPPLGDVTAVEGDGGASLSRPLKEVEAVTVPNAEPETEPASSGPTASHFNGPERSDAAPADPEQQTTVRVEPVSDFERQARADAQAASRPSHDDDATPPVLTETSLPESDEPVGADDLAAKRDRNRQARRVKSDAERRQGGPEAGGEGEGQGSTSEMPSFGVEAMQEPRSEEEERHREEKGREGDAVERRVAEAIRDGDL